jgi:tetratricopeptide (TPR) repeat protein
MVAGAAGGGCLPEHPNSKEVPDLALFGSKKDDATKATGAPGGASGEPVFSPEKAAKFFQHAGTVHETGSYEYAMKLWLDGLRWDPANMEGVQGFFRSVAAFLGESGGKRSVSRDVVRGLSGKGDVDRYLLGLLEWGLKPTDAVLAVRALEGAGKLRLAEVGKWIGERALGAALKEKKVRKDLLVRIAEILADLGAPERAIAAAEEAQKLDRSDGDLAAFIRSLAAQATMHKGGYEQAGQPGGFRASIRDAEKQRYLEEADRIVKTEETIDRLLSAAENEYIKRPGDIPSIEKYAKLLVERGRPEDEEKAHSLYMQAYELSKAFRFRELAGAIRMRQARRKVAELRKMLDQSPNNEMLVRMHDQALREALELECAECRLQVEAYPTDLTRKYELGRRYFQLGRYNEAIELLQEAQHDPKNRAAALSLLGQAFLKIGWNDEGIGALRTALEIREVLPEVNLELRYWLMCALQAKAEQERDLDAAIEADRLASSIALQSIGYMDIRQRREAVKKLVTELRGNKA